MARTRCRPRPTQDLTLVPALTACPACGQSLRIDYHNARTLTTLDGVTRLSLHIRRCHNAACSRYRRPYRPEAEAVSPYPTTSSAWTSSPWSGASVMRSTAASPRSIRT